MSRFSRGPWIPVSSSREFGHTYICSPSHGNSPICLVITSKNRDVETDKANLALFLDVPVIHKALASLVDAIEGGGGTLEDAVAKAKALLDKHKCEETPAVIQLFK